MRLQSFEKPTTNKVVGFLLSYTLVCIYFSITIFSAWNFHPLISLFSFIPFFHTLSSSLYSKWQRRLLIFSLFFLYNLVITSWLLCINETNGWLPIFANSLFLYLVLPLSSLINIIIKKKILSFVAAFLLIEWVHFNWIFAWPWLTIGNVFGSHPSYIQWYQYTGVLGGSFWILLTNFLFYRLVNVKILLPFVLGPIIFSLIALKTRSIVNNRTLNVVFCQPNFRTSDSLSDRMKVNNLVSKTTQVVGKNAQPDLIVFPELCLSEDYWKETFIEHENYKHLRQKIKDFFPTSTILIGAKVNLLSTDAEHFSDEKVRKLGGLSFTSYNVAIAIDSTSKVRYKSKKILIPKTEYWPQSINRFIPDSTSCNYALGSDPDIIDVKGQKILIAICYESLFENYCSLATENDVSLIVVMASESFLKGNSQAMSQYLNISRIRAIENQKFLIKCSNQGYSAVITPEGQITQLLSSNQIGYSYYKIPVK